MSFSDALRHIANKFENTERDNIISDWVETENEKAITEFELEGKRFPPERNIRKRCFGNSELDEMVKYSSINITIRFNTLGNCIVVEHEFTKETIDLTLIGDEEY